MTPPKPTPTNHQRSTSKKRKAKRSAATDDDTPKAFKRLMAYAATKKRPNGLDDPKPPSSSTTSKKRKRGSGGGGGDDNETDTSKPVDTITSTTADTTDKAGLSKKLTLLPNEKLSDFSRRVDAAIPISFKGLQRGEDNPKLRKNKKKKNPTDDENDEEGGGGVGEITEDAYDFDDNGDPLPNHLKPHNHNPNHNHKNERKKGRREKSPSPFSILRQKRGAVQSSINDVVQAPPSLVVPREKLRDKTKPAGGGGSIQGLEVPKASGSLARREMLQEERRGVVERYRALMAAKGGGL